MKLQWTFLRDFLDLPPINLFLTALVPSTVSVVAILSKTAAPGLPSSLPTLALFSGCVAIVWAACRITFWIIMPDLFKNYKTMEKWLEERQKSHPSAESWPKVFNQNVQEWNEENDKVTSWALFVVECAFLDLLVGFSNFLFLFLELH